MILGIDQLDPTVQGIFYLIAVVLFVLAALVTVRPVERAPVTVGLVPLGLACVAFVWCWNAFAAA